MKRTAGFEKHLDEKMESLGYNQGDYEIDQMGDDPSVTMMKPTSASELRKLAMKLKPDFNAKVRGDALVFLPVGRYGSSIARELLAVARIMCGESDEKFDVGDKVTFSADASQMSGVLDVPDGKKNKYEGKVSAVSGDTLTVKLSSPGFAAGKVMTVNVQKEDTLQIG